MLTWPHHHVLSRRDVRQGRLAGVGMRYPYRNGKPVGGASEDNRDGTGEV